VHLNKALLGEKLGGVRNNLGAKTEKESMGRNAASQVGKGSKVFGGVVFLLDRILLRSYSMDQSLY